VLGIRKCSWKGKEKRGAKGEPEGAGGGFVMSQGGKDVCGAEQKKDLQILQTGNRDSHAYGPDDWRPEMLGPPFVVGFATGIPFLGLVRNRTL